MSPEPNAAGKLLRVRLMNIATGQIVSEMPVGVDMLPLGINIRGTFIRNVARNNVIIIFEDEVSDWGFLLALDVGWSVRYSSVVRNFRDRRTSGVCIEDMSDVTCGTIESNMIPRFRIRFNFVDPE